MSFVTLLVPVFPCSFVVRGESGSKPAGEGGAGLRCLLSGRQSSYLLLLSPHSFHPLPALEGFGMPSPCPTQGGGSGCSSLTRARPPLGETGARPGVLRTSGVGAAQRASRVWDGCRPGSLVLSVLYAVLRTPLGCPHRGRLGCTYITRHRVMPRVPLRASSHVHVRRVRCPHVSS